MAGTPLRSSGDFHQEIVPVDLLHPITGFGHGGVSVGSQRWGDLDGHEPIPSVPRLVDRGQDVASTCNVPGHDGLGDLDGGCAGLFQIEELFGVIVGAHDGIGEDRRVGGDPCDRVFLDTTGQFAGVEHFFGDLVGPHADACCG